MIRKLILFTILTLLLISCNQQCYNNSKEVTKKEIVQIEKEFEQMVATNGLADAFLTYADTDAVLNRNDQLIIGKVNMRLYFDKQSFTNVKLSWEPDFVDVSSSGDLAYTYGKYQFKATDSLDNQIEADGIFHTIWKKQEDGNWKFVWD